MPDDVRRAQSSSPARSGARAEAAIARTPRPRLAITLAAIVVSVSVALGVRPVSDPSPWLHLKVGAFLMDGGRFGSPDPWAPFATVTYVPTEWLPAIAGQVIYQNFGLPGIAWLRCAGILGLLSALVWSARRSANTLTAVLVSFVGLVGAYGGLTERPQLAGLAFLALAVGAWWRTGLDLRPRWWLVPVTWLWACVHGLSIPVLSVLAAGLTPLGPQLLLTSLAVGKNGSEFVAEWQATSVRNPFAVVTLAMIGLVILSWVRSERRPAWWQVGFLLMGIVTTLATMRTSAVGAVIAVPLLAQEIQLYRGRPMVAATRPSRGAWAALILTALVVAAPLAAARAQDPAHVPQRLEPALSLIPSGTVVLAAGDISGWLFWAHPSVRPVLDPRIEIYSPAHVRSFVSTMAAGPGWKQFVHRTGARYALVPSGSPIATALVERAAWSQIGKDAGLVLLRAR